jgi:hypothetical protein
MQTEERVAKALGIFSLGLGVAQLIAPNGLSRLIGVGNAGRLMQGLGAREIASGVGILKNERPAGWLWSRVGGDVMDLALLGAALKNAGSEKRKVAAAAVLVGGIAIFDLVMSRRMSR